MAIGLLSRNHFHSRREENVLSFTTRVHSLKHRPAFGFVRVDSKFLAASENGHSKVLVKKLHQVGLQNKAWVDGEWICSRELMIPTTDNITLSVWMRLLANQLFWTGFWCCEQHDSGIVTEASFGGKISSDWLLPRLQLSTANYLW